MTSHFEAHLLVDCKAVLGEGIQWNPARRRVYWTDIKGKSLWSCREDGSEPARMELDVGLCSFAFSDDGRILGAFEDGLSWLDPVTGRRALFERYQPGMPTTRMNDGALDRAGRFVVGGIDEADLAPITPIWSVDRSDVRVILDGVGCANSTAFNLDGTRMYFADSPTGEIQVFDYDTARGVPSNRRVFARLRPAEGVPDGSITDSEGGLWNAQYGGGAVQRFLPDGTRDIRVSVAAPNVTSCAIGGQRFRRMFITTARQDMTDEALKAWPLSGGVFSVDLPVSGFPVGTYRR